MEKVMTVIVGIVVVALCLFVGYDIHQSSLRNKELDKKRSDNLDDQKEIAKQIKKNMEEGKFNVIVVHSDGSTSYCDSKKKSEKKKTVKLSKEKSN